MRCAVSFLVRDVYQKMEHETSAKVLVGVVQESAANGKNSPKIDYEKLTFHQD